MNEAGPRVRSSDQAGGALGKISMLCKKVPTLEFSLLQVII